MVASYTDQFLGLAVQLVLRRHKFETPEDVQRWCRMAEFRGCYTSLQEDLDMALAPDGSQQVRKVVLPLKAFWWHHVGRPGGWSHITLEECRALRWATERRLHSARDLGKRCLHPVDNSSVSGACAKGRSASRALNYEMKKMMSVQILGGLWVFAPWMKTQVIGPAAGSDCALATCCRQALSCRCASGQSCEGGFLASGLLGVKADYQLLC